MTPDQIAEQIVTEYLGVTFSRPGDAPEWLRKRIVAEIQKSVIEERCECVNHHADADRFIAWIKNPKREPAMIAFTEGPDRQVAYAIEGMFLELWAVADAASYCYRHNKIDRGAVLFTRLDEKLKALKEGPR